MKFATFVIALAVAMPMLVAAQTLIASGVAETGTVAPNAFEYYHITPTHPNFNLRVTATTLDDNIDLMVREGQAPTVGSSAENYNSIRESNPWGIDIGPEAMSTNKWYVGVRGDNKPPQQTGDSEYTVRVTLEFNFDGFNCTTCASSDCTNCNLSPVGSVEFVEDTFELDGSTVTRGVARLTPSVADTKGALWFDTKLDLSIGFDTVFQFRIHNFSLCGADNFCGGGDGFAFVVQNDGTTAVGGSGYGIGYASNEESGDGGIVKSLAVEFDTWNDRGNIYDIKQGIVSKWIGAKQYIDYRDNHVAVMSMGVGANNASHVNQIGGTPSIPTMADEEVHVGRVKYFAPYISVFIDDMRRPVLTVQHTLTNDVELDSSGRAYIGFTSATGDAYETHDIVSWYYCERVGCTP